LSTFAASESASSPPAGCRPGSDKARSLRSLASPVRRTRVRPAAEPSLGRRPERRVVRQDVSHRFARSRRIRRIECLGTCASFGTAVRTTGSARKFGKLNPRRARIVVVAVALVGRPANHSTARLPALDKDHRRAKLRATCSKADWMSSACCGGCTGGGRRPSRRRRRCRVTRSQLLAERKYRAYACGARYSRLPSRCLHYSLSLRTKSRLTAAVITMQSRSPSWQRSYFSPHRSTQVSKSVYGISLAGVSVALESKDILY